MAIRMTRWTSSAGIWIGALAWATSTELNYALVPWVCSSGIRLIPWAAGALVIVALFGARLSWQAFARREQRLEAQSPTAGTPHEMLAMIGMLAGLLFALIIVMQGTAAFFLTGCEP